MLHTLGGALAIANHKAWPEDSNAVMTVHEHNLERWISVKTVINKTIAGMLALVLAIAAMNTNNQWLNTLQAATSFVDNFTPMNVGGQSVGNRSQYDGGRALAFDGNAIYYSNSSWRLSKMNMDGSNKQAIGTKSVVGSISIDNGWVYYGTYNRDAGIHKVRTDGTDHTTLNDTLMNVSGTMVANGYIYFNYASSGDGYGFYRMPISGGSYEKIIDSKVGTFNIEYNRVFYTLHDTNNDRGIFVSKLDGTYIGKIVDCDSRWVEQIFTINGQWLYYVDNSATELWKIKLDGTQNTLVWSVKDVGRGICGFNVDNGWVYCMIATDNKFNGVHVEQLVCKVKTDGTTGQIIARNSDLPSGTTITDDGVMTNGDWVYFNTTTDPYYHGAYEYRIRNDGSILYSLNDMTSKSCYPSPLSIQAPTQVSTQKPTTTPTTPTTTAPITANIPVDAVSYNGHSYKVFNIGLTWHDAKAYCESLGGYLATITSQGEQTFINGLITGNEKINLWIGATDEIEEGHWKWVTTEPFNYSNWHQGNPNNWRGIEHYAGLVTRQVRFDYEAYLGEWNDWSDTWSNGSKDDFGFICEWGTDSTQQSTGNIVYLETLTPTNSDRYTGNEGDSCIKPMTQMSFGRESQGYTDVQGNIWQHGLTAWVARWNYGNEVSWVWNDYSIGGKYEYLTGKIVLLPHRYTKDFDTKFEVIGDGRTLFSMNLTPNNIPTADLKINVQGVKTLRISLYDNKPAGGGSPFGLANFGLTTSDTISTVSQIKVLLNGSKIDFFDQEPIIKNSRTLAPLRAIFEALGASVTWNDATKTITAIRGSKTISMTVGSTTAKISNQNYLLDVPPEIVNNRTVVPLRFIAEAFDCYVFWNAPVSTIEITDGQDAYTIARVKKYTSEFDYSQVQSIVNSAQPDSEKYLALASIVNEGKMGFDERWDYNSLICNDMYIAYQFKNYVRGNLFARSALGLSSLTFGGETTDYLVGEWPEKNKYKDMLRSYISETQDYFKFLEYAQEVGGFADDILKSVYGIATDPKIMRISSLRTTLRDPAISLEKLSSTCDDILDEARSLAKNEQSFKVISKGSKLSEALGRAGTALQITNVAIDSLQDIMFASANIRVYEDYINIFDAIAKDKNTLPTALKVAARELKDELHGNYSTIIQKAAQDLGGIAAGDAIDAYAIASGGILSSISLGINIGSFLGNIGLGMKDITDGSTYTEGYAYLSELFVGVLKKDRQTFIDSYNGSYDKALVAANTFKSNYQTLQLLRLGGEKAYLKMASFDSALLKNQMRSWTNYAEMSSFCKDSISRIESYAYR